MEVFLLLKVFVFSSSFGVGVVGLVISFVQIYLSQALIITHIMRFLDCPGLIFHFIHTIMGLHACSIFATPGMEGTSL